MDAKLLDRLQTLQQHAEMLEKGMAELREEIKRVTQEVAKSDTVVARYMINNQIYEVTQADADAVRAELTRPYAENAIHKLAVIKKAGKKQQKLPRDVRFQQLFETMEAIRAEAIANGTAIDDDAEAAIDD